MQKFQKVGELFFPEQSEESPQATEDGNTVGRTTTQTKHYYPASEHLPLSYAFNATFFHEAVPACWYGEPKTRPRSLPEIEETSRLFMLGESRLPHPGLGSWAVRWQGQEPGTGVFHQHNGLTNFLFVDQHLKSLPLSRTCTDKMWSDRFPDKSGGCDGRLLEEYQ